MTLQSLQESHSASLFASATLGCTPAESVTHHAGGVVADPTGTSRTVIVQRSGHTGMFGERARQRGFENGDQTVIQYAMHIDDAISVAADDEFTIDGLVHQVWDVSKPEGGMFVVQLMHTSKATVTKKSNRALVD